MELQIRNVNISATEPLISPAELRRQAPVPESVEKTVLEAREAVKLILDGQDRRLIVIVGPCSIHDEKSSFEYAEKLQELSQRVADRMLLLMRVYFEKPRTVLGWKGLISDPRLNNTFHMAEGIWLARQILIKIGELGLPAATEMLEPITPQYIADLITSASIGARTTESPTHRQMASGLSMPVGYKNGTDGNLSVAVNGMNAAQGPHRFLGIDDDGHTCIICTRGNPWGHLILRGGYDGPNYDEVNLAAASELLSKSNLRPRFMVDCSHANSNKDYRRQSVVWNDVLKQRIAGNETIVGLMLESHLNAGQQKLDGDPSVLNYGVSITDGCLGWDETEQLISTAYDQLA